MHTSADTHTDSKMDETGSRPNAVPIPLSISNPNALLLLPLLPPQSEEKLEAEKEEMMEAMALEVEEVII